jgi:acyl-[acyl carrier protein]--UDP-N-acetylglucosamine O-acyltransferase
LKNAYRILYRSELPLEAAVKQLTELAPSQPELLPLLTFIENSERSLIR